MFRPIVRLLVLGCVVLGVSLAWAFSTGPPIARTGAIGNVTYPAEGTCTSCHSGNPLNDPSGQLQVLDVPATYQPDQVYTLRVRLRYDLAPATAKWGFELVALRASDLKGGGTLVTPNPGPGPSFPDSLLIKTATAGVYLGSNRQWIEHSTFSTRTNQTGPVEWHFDWKAPSTNEGKVYFFASGNAANGTGATDGDHIFTAADSTAFPPVPATGGPSWLIVLAATLILSGGVVLVRRGLLEPTR